MTMWKKLKSTLTMKIPGPTWTLFLMVASLGTITVFVYCITNSGYQKKIHWKEVFLVKNESLDLLLKVEKEGELHLKVTGATTTGSSPELTADVKEYGRDTFTRQIISLHSTPGKVNFEETRQLFLNNVLTESLTDGTPAFYNSNILGRYYRKDYFSYDT